MEQLGIKKDAYYKDLNYLDIKPEKDSEGRVYLTEEQADQIRALRNHVNETGKRGGFSTSSIIKVDDSNFATSTNSNSEEDIYVEPEEPTAQFNLNGLIREAAELKAREVAMADLMKRAIADQMTEEELPEDLKEKVALAREAANPKFTPAEVATTLLNQWRSNRGGK